MASSNDKAVEPNDRAVVAPERTKTKATSRIRWTVGLLVRLCIWYFLLTPFFRCPSNISDLAESSPRICKPYLVAKSYVEPRVTPYYNAYAAPYVDAARPYVRVLNDKVYTPASNIAKQGYETYGAPALDQAQAYGQQQWDANIVPHIQTAKDKATDWYKSQVEPHVEYAATTVSPYYHKVHGAYWTTLDGYILPFAAKYQPFIGKTYTSGQEILTTRVMPQAQSAWFSTVYLVNHSLWPKVSSLYSENVEPQLVKIGQRLASYREGNRLGEVTDEVESSTGHSTLSSSTSAVVSANETPTPSLSPSELAAQIRDKVASDLITWKERFASASEKGVENLEGRVVEIVDTYLASGVQSDGEKLVAALESAVEDQTATVRHHISVLAESLPFEDAPEQEEAAVEELLKGIRNSAMSIRDRAHFLREWHFSFDQELIRRVSVAVNSTLAVLDNVRDLGLQEIGMRWAWLDGVTYRDWENYHALKEEFEDWKHKFREIGLQHARIEAVKDTADETLSRAMDIAEAAAKELARLKEVGRWKIAAREVSEDFDTRSEPPPPLPKPTVVAEEDIPVVPQEDQEVPFDAEGEASDPNDSMPDADAQTNTESPELDEVDKVEQRDENQDAGADDEPSDSTSESAVHSEDSEKDENKVTVETTEPKDEDDLESNKAAFGAEAAAVGAEKAAAGRDDDTDSLDNDQVVDTETKKVSEAGGEELNAEPTPSQAPTQNKAIEDLLSHILADRDSAFAKKVLKKLNTVVETPQPSPDSVLDAAEVPEQPQIADSVIEPLGSDDSDSSSDSAANSVETEPKQATDASEDQFTQDDL
ncbi:hypothetical protein BDW62DRAFT_88677 [Aspergillus aurantiobrunneus]